MHKMSRLLRWPGWQDQAGSSGVEFALIAPVVILILAGIFEIGLVIRARFALVSMVSAAANHTLSVGGRVDDTSADNFAATIAALLGGAGRSATVNVNNAVAAVLVDGSISTAKSGAAVSSCYCASRPQGQIVWGSAVECGVACDGSSPSGRYVEISARTSFSPSMGIFGFLSDQTLQNTAMVRLP